MSIKDIFNASKIKAENEELRSMITPEIKDVAEAKSVVRQLQEEASSLIEDITKRKGKIFELDVEISNKKKQLLDMDDEILVQEFGLYHPHYSFANSDEYKQKIKNIRDSQKSMIKYGFAATGNENWTVNGSQSQGKKMVRDMQKLLLRAFNSECDELVDKVKYNNYELSLKRITASRDAISKLGEVMGISISEGYYNSKVDELCLAYGYQVKKQEEKEALKAAREEMREAAKLQKEIEAQRQKVKKEQAHYQKALISVLKQIEEASPEQRKELDEKKAELENVLGDIDLSLNDLDYREANQKAGYVYVISNIGSFGENVYKIGMTRRLDPQERIDELGDASVPFNFDVHAMIFSDDAPALEAALHNAFADRKVNMINQRREFFRVTLDEIKQVVKNNFDKTVEFIDVPDAEQYRLSQKMAAENS